MEVSKPCMSDDLLDGLVAYTKARVWQQYAGTLGGSIRTAWTPYTEKGFFFSAFFAQWIASGSGRTLFQTQAPIYGDDRAKGKQVQAKLYCTLCSVNLCL